MKIKFLTLLSIAAFSIMIGCKSATNTNVANTNTVMNANSMTNSMANTMTVPTVDSVAATAVKDALQKAGLSGVTVSATTTEVTLRGTVPKGKLGEAVRIANETGKRKVNNELTEK